MKLKSSVKGVKFRCFHNTELNYMQENSTNRSNWSAPVYYQTKKNITRFLVDLNHNIEMNMIRLYSNPFNSQLNKDPIPQAPKITNSLDEYEITKIKEQINFDKTLVELLETNLKILERTKYSYIFQ